MESLEKISQLRSQLLGPPSENPDALELTLRTVVQIAAPMVAKILPATSGETDEFLEHVALQLLRVRSDGAPLSPGFLEGLTELMHAELGLELEAPAPTPETPAPVPVRSPPIPETPPADPPAPAPAPAPEPPEPAPEPPEAAAPSSYVRSA